MLLAVLVTALSEASPTEYDATVDVEVEKPRFTAPAASPAARKPTCPVLRMLHSVISLISAVMEEFAVLALKRICASACLKCFSSHQE